MLIPTVADNILIFFFLFFRGNMIWYFMWIICLAHDSHGMPSLIFPPKNNTFFFFLMYATFLCSALVVYNNISVQKMKIKPIVIEKVAVIIWPPSRWGSFKGCKFYWWNVNYRDSPDLTMVGWGLYMNYNRLNMFHKVLDYIFLGSGLYICNIAWGIKKTIFDWYDSMR